MQTLAGRTCIFAGATAGDGPETVRALCRGGMNVALISHMPERAAGLMQEINEGDYAGKVEVFTETVSAEDAKNSAFAKVYEVYGSVDVVICNTGTDGKVDDMETLPTQDLQEEVSHLLGMSFDMLQTAIPYLKKSKAPRVILMTTADGCMGGTFESFANAVGKGAVRALALNAAARLAPSGITVNLISKGTIPRMELQPEDAIDTAKRLPFIPMGKLGTQADLAGAVCFFASEESGFVTGQIMELNGGLNLGR